MGVLKDKHWQQVGGEMLRRVLLQSLGNLVGILALPAPARAQGKRIVLQTSPIAGFQYHAGESLRPLLAVGAPLALMREPDNPHDERAVRIDWSGHKLGYMPRVGNTMIANLIDQGLPVQARIVRLWESRDPSWRVACEITLLI